jgi:Tfp pilus assembly protein PilN
MKSLLWRGLSRLSIGLVIDARRIAICVMRVSPLGRRILTHEVHDRGAEPAVDIVRRLLQPWIPPRRGRNARPGPWVQLGIPEADAFLSVLPITQANRNASAQAFFLEAVQATNVRAEDRIIDLVRLEIDQQPLACVSASPSAAIHGVADMVSGLGARVGLIQHTPAALYSAGVSHAKPPRGSKLCARFFLGTHQAIGILGAGQQPLFWHAFQLVEGRESAVLLAAYSTLWMLRRNARITVPVDTVIVHGRPELALGQDADEFRQRTGARLVRCAEPGYGIISAALGLAHADPFSLEPRHDLARTFKPAPMIRDIFPWPEFALHGALLGGVSLFMGATASEADSRLQAANAELSAFAWSKGMNQAKLEAEKKALEERSKVFAMFRGGRVAWSVPLHTIAAAVPEGTVITSLSGDAEVETGARSGPGRSKKQLVVGFETPMAGDGALPHEIDGFLASVRSDASIKQHFPLIEVSGLRANPVTPGGAPSASYSIVALPKIENSKNQAKR